MLHGVHLQLLAYTCFLYMAVKQPCVANLGMVDFGWHKRKSMSCKIGVDSTDLMHNNVSRVSRSRGNISNACSQGIDIAELQPLQNNLILCRQFLNGIYREWSSVNCGSLCWGYHKRAHPFSLAMGGMLSLLIRNLAYCSAQLHCCSQITAICDLNFLTMAVASCFNAAPIRSR